MEINAIKIKPSKGIISRLLGRGFFKLEPTYLSQKEEVEFCKLPPLIFFGTRKQALKVGQIKLAGAVR